MAAPQQSEIRRQSHEDKTSPGTFAPLFSSIKALVVFLLPRLSPPTPPFHPWPPEIHLWLSSLCFAAHPRGPKPSMPTNSNNRLSMCPAVTLKPATYTKRTSKLTILSGFLGPTRTLPVQWAFPRLIPRRVACESLLARSISES